MLRPRRRLSHAPRFALLFAVVLAGAGCATKVKAPPEPPVAVRLGDAAFEAGDFEGAIRDYRLYIADVDRGEFTARAYYQAALAHYNLEDYTGAISTLDELEGRYPGAVWVQVSALRGDAERELGRPSEAVLAWDAAWPEANEIETPRLRNRIQGAIASLSRAELHALRDDVASGEVGALVDQEIASRTPPPITDPIPPVAAESASVVAATVAPDNQAPEKDTVVGAWRRFNEDSSAASRTRDDGSRAATAPAETVILESGSAPAPVPSPEAKVRAFDESETPPVAAETTPQNDEDVAQLIKVDGPLDADSANFEPAAAAPVAAGDGKVGLRRIEYPGAVAGPAARREPAPSVDTLEKLEVTGEPAAP